MKLKLFDYLLVNCKSMFTEKLKNSSINLVSIFNSINTGSESSVFKLNTNNYSVFVQTPTKLLLLDRKNNIDLINKLFDGQNTSIKHKLVNSLFSFVIGFKVSNNRKSLYSLRNDTVYSNKYSVKFNFYRVGLSLFPLTVQSSLDITNYIYSIYKYIMNKHFNFYKACLISLCYYYFGLMTALICLYNTDNINILDSNISVIVAKLSSFVVICVNNYTNFSVGTVLNIKLLNILNNSFYLCSEPICQYRPFLLGLTKYMLVSSGMLSKVSFQETLQFFKNMIWEHKIEWEVDSKCNIILSNFTPIGSGWYRYFCN